MSIRLRREAAGLRDTAGDEEPTNDSQGRVWYSKILKAALDAVNVPV